MQLQTEKIELAKSILETNSQAILKQVKAVLNSYKTDLWDELSEQQKLLVKKAQQELKQGKGKPHNVVMKKYSKWITK